MTLTFEMSVNNNLLIISRRNSQDANICFRNCSGLFTDFIDNRLIVESSGPRILNANVTIQFQPANDELSPSSEEISDEQYALMILLPIGFIGMCVALLFTAGRVKN